MIERNDRILDDEPNYTQTLWYAIRETGNVDWVRRGGAASDTGFWETWLKLAMENKEENYDWDAVGEKNRLMEEASRAAEEAAARVYARRSTAILTD